MAITQRMPQPNYNQDLNKLFIMFIHLTIQYATFGNQTTGSMRLEMNPISSLQPFLSQLCYTPLQPGPSCVRAETHQANIKGLVEEEQVLSHLISPSSGPKTGT